MLCVVGNRPSDWRVLMDMDRVDWDLDFEDDADAQEQDDEAEHPGTESGQRQR